MLEKEPLKEAQIMTPMCFLALAAAGASVRVVETSPLAPMMLAESADGA